MKPTDRSIVPTETLIVFELSETFTAALASLAHNAGMRVQRSANLSELVGTSGSAVAIVAAVEDEPEMETLFRALSASRIDAAALLERCDHRLAVRLLRAGADDVFVMSSDGAALEEWLAGQRQRVAQERESLDSSYIADDESPARMSAIVHRAAHEALALCDGNKSQAARRLGISRTRLQRLLGGSGRDERSATASPTGSATTPS